MESRQRAIVTLRWIQWSLSAFSFGVCMTYFLVNVNFYLWTPAIFRAQVGLTGVIHIYLYLAAIWTSVKPQGHLTWALLDIIFGILAAAAIGTSQSSIAEYCSKTSFTLYWSDSNFAYVPSNQRSSSDKSDMTYFLNSSSLTRSCGMNAGVVVANGLLMLVTPFHMSKNLQVNLSQLSFCVDGLPASQTASRSTSRTNS